MFQGSRFCARCGAEATRETVDDEGVHKCPRCKEEMQALRLGGTSVQECSACGGVWLHPEAFQHLCEAREEHSAIVGLLAIRTPTANPALDIVRYVPCPNCAKLMNRVNFSRSSGVIVDVCKSHGIWFDRGELQRVIEFVEDGGLAVAREREREHLQDEQRRLAAMEAGSEHIPEDLHVFAARLVIKSSSSDSPVDGRLLAALSMFIK